MRHPRPDGLLAEDCVAFEIQYAKWRKLCHLVWRPGTILAWGRLELIAGACLEAEDAEPATAQQDDFELVRDCVSPERRLDLKLGQVVQTCNA